MSLKCGLEFRANARRKQYAVWVLLELLCLGAAEPKATNITLAELVQKSDVVVFGHFVSSNGTDREGIPFVPESVLKGSPKINGVIFFCDVHAEEYPDLSKMEGTSVIFAVRSQHCLNLSHAERSIVYVESETVNTVEINGQPDFQPIKEFLRKIRALVTEQAGVQTSRTSRAP
jgi:hypothetical protein